MIQLFSHYFSWRLLLLSVIEAAVLFMSILIGIQLRIPAGDPTPSAYDATVFTIAMLAMMNALGLYSRNPESASKTVQRLLVALFFAFFISSAVFYVFPWTVRGPGDLRNQCGHFGGWTADRPGTFFPGLQCVGIEATHYGGRLRRSRSGNDWLSSRH